MLYQLSFLKYEKGREGSNITSFSFPFLVCLAAAECLEHALGWFYSSVEEFSLLQIS